MTSGRIWGEHGFFDTYHGSEKKEGCKGVRGVKLLIDLVHKGN